MTKAAQRTRALIGAADPARHAPPGSPRRSAAELIAYAESTPAPRLARSMHIRRRLVIAAGVTTVAAGVTAVVQPFGTAGLGLHWPPGGAVAGPASPGAVLAPIGYQFGGNAPAAGPQLRALAARIGPAPYDSSTGRYAYHRLQRFGDPTLTVENHSLGYCTAQRIWELPDRSGVAIDTELPPQFPDQASRDYFATRMPPQRSGHRYEIPGGPDAAPLPTDRAGLAARLDARYGAGAVTKRVDALYAHSVVPQATRSLVLSILADVPGFRWRGTVTDRAGRRGVAITADDPANNERFLLIFDPRTGTLLADEAVFLGPQRVSAYTTILETTRTDHTG